MYRFLAARFLKWGLKKKILYHVLLGKPLTCEVTGISELLNYWLDNHPDKNMNIISVTTMTAHGHTEKEYMSRIERNLYDFNNEHNANIKCQKIATCSLFDLKYISENSTRSPNYFGKLLSIVELNGSV